MVKAYLIKKIITESKVLSLMGLFSNSKYTKMGFYTFMYMLKSHDSYCVSGFSSGSRLVDLKIEIVQFSNFYDGEASLEFMKFNPILTLYERND